VASDALVIPRDDLLGTRRRSSSFLPLNFSLIASKIRRSSSWPGSSSVEPLELHPHLLQHLAHDQLDVLVVDVDALRPVDALPPRPRCRPSVLVRPLDREDLGRIEASPRSAGPPLLDALCRARPGRSSGGGNEYACSSPLSSVIVSLTGLVGLLNGDLAADLSDLRQALRLASSLEELHDTAGRTLSDVQARRRHRCGKVRMVRLGARLADRLARR